MDSCRRIIDVTKLILVVWFILVSFSHGGRLSTSTHQNREKEKEELNVFKMKPKGDGDHKYSGHFLGFLPRRMPIPTSGPSRKHNDIGLKALRSPYP